LGKGDKLQGKLYRFDKKKKKKKKVKSRPNTEDIWGKGLGHPEKKKRRGEKIN